MGGDGFDGGVAGGGGFTGGFAALGLGGEICDVLGDGGVEGGDLAGSDAGQIVGFGFGGESAGVGDEGVTVRVKALADEVTVADEVRLRVVVGDRLQCTLVVPVYGSERAIHIRVFLRQDAKTPREKESSKSLEPQIVTRISNTLTNRENGTVLAEIHKEVSATNQRFPLP